MLAFAEASVDTIGEDFCAVVRRRGTGPSPTELAAGMMAITKASAPEIAEKLPLLFSSDEERHLKAVGEFIMAQCDSRKPEMPDYGRKS